MTQWKLVPVEPTRAMLVAAHMIERDGVELTEDEHRAMYAAFLSASPSPQGDEVERAAEQPAWGVWVDYNRAPPGSYACLVSRLINGEWGEPEAKWMPAQGRPPLPGKIRIMPHLMPGDPLALSALPRRETVPTLTEEERERVQKMRERNARDNESNADWDHTVMIWMHLDRDFLLSLISKLTNQEPTP